MQCRRILVLFFMVLIIYILLTTLLYFYIINFTEWGGGKGLFNTSKTPKSANDNGNNNNNNNNDNNNKKSPPPKPPPVDEKTRKMNAEIDDIVKRSNEFKSQKKWDEALKLLDEGIVKYPNSDKLHTFKGGWYFDQAKYADAEKWYKKAMELNPKEALYPSNVALCLVKQQKHKEASFYYKKAYELKPSISQLVSIADISCKMNSWENYDEYIDKIISATQTALKNGKSSPVNPYLALHMPFGVADLYKICKAQSQNIYNNAMKKAEGIPKFTFRPVNVSRRIRVGYVSYDFRNHAVGIQIKNMFAMHDRNKFEIFAYNVNDGAKDKYNDGIYQKIKAGVDHMVEIGGFSLKDASERIYNDGIDVLIDLGLFTAYSRMDIFAVRPAPIQVAWLGLATTTGADYYDYIIVDKFVAPDEYKQYYSEKRVLMPHSYHIFDHKQAYPIQQRPEKSKQNYPEKFLFCNHANNYRMDPHIFDIWMNIVKKVENSTFVLKYFNNDSATNVRREAEKRGMRVSSDNMVSQLIFMPSASGAEHIRLKSMCDLYLDVHKYNGHSTSGDMLWAGVPMVTYPGETMASRAAGSFSRSVGAPEMIATSWKEYEEKAIYFAQNPQVLQPIRKRIEDGRNTHPLFDTQRWIQNWERAMIEMTGLHARGEKPRDIHVKDVHEA